MDSSSPSSFSSSSPTEQSTFYDAVFPVAKSRRTPSFSSSSSSSSSLNDDSPSLPATPLNYPSGGVPFSWEKLPGIPKKPDSPSLKVTISDDSNPNPSQKVLPLPPPITPTAASRRFNFEESGRVRRASTFSTSSSRFVVPRDPFFAALVECSKGDGSFSDDQELLSGGERAKVGRSISDRFGFVGMYASCKRTCAVSESIVYMPRSSPGRPSYDLLSRRR
ncbi:unnamed protein product [Linum tenue]|uniref:Uncharacterized protein n=1 Tax=Linum tenue TaxID=586396 RepID=A0AAV0IJ76_9ROSI|nr:unnamed protein product [Linum tenue]